MLAPGVIAPDTALILNPAGAALYTPPGVPVSVTFCTPAVLHHGEPVYDMLAVGNAVMVIGEVAVTTPQPPAAAIVLVTVYVPGVLADRSTCPVAVLTNTSPAVELNVPATPPPLYVGNGSAPLLQYGVAE